MPVEARLTPEQQGELKSFLARAHPTAKAVREWFAERGQKIAPDTARAVRARLGPPGRDAPYRRHFCKVDKVLKPEDRDAYYAYLYTPQTTAESALKWLQDRGCKIGILAVRTHRNAELKSVRDTEFAAKAAAAFGRLARIEGVVVMTDGMVTRFEQTVMEYLVRENKDNPHSPKDLFELACAVNKTVDSRRGVEDEMRTTAKARLEAVKASDATAKKPGATPLDVAIRVREMLGFPIPEHVRNRQQALHRAPPTKGLPDAVADHDASTDDADEPLASDAMS